MLYDVTVTRTGGVTIEATSEEEAIRKVSEMSCNEIDKKGNLTGWETSNVMIVDDCVINNQSDIYEGQRLTDNGDYLTLELYDIDDICYDFMYLRVKNNDKCLNALNISIRKHFKSCGCDDLYNVPSYEVEDYLIDELKLIENQERKEAYND